jgi:hypothetical protein
MLLIVKNTLKLLLLKIFKRKNIFIIFLVILKQSFWAIRQIKRINFKYSIILIPKIIYGYYFYNKEINFFKKEDINIFFNTKYKFDYHSDFTTSFLFWKNIINKISKIKYLEIGSFEGRSASFIKEFSNLESLMAVDTFQGSDELKNIDYKKVYENFKYNLNLEGGGGNENINFIKDNSDNFFNNNKSYYNLIYIDGSHHYEQVKKDFINSFNFLENNGYIICDDFMWFYYDKIELNPMKAILDCYELYKDRLSVEFVNYQIIFKKLI